MYLHALFLLMKYARNMITWVKRRVFVQHIFTVIKNFIGGCRLYDIIVQGVYKITFIDLNVHCFLLLLSSCSLFMQAGSIARKAGSIGQKY